MPINPDELFEWIGDPVDGPMPFVMMTEGWIEASEAMARVHETITHQANLVPLIEFDTDRLIDQRARRPLLPVIDGLMQPLEWPRLIISLGTDSRDQPFLYMHGPEPDFNWRPFATAVATAVQSIGVSSMFTIGAYPVPSPHTRPIRISFASNCKNLLAGKDHTTGSMSVPIGVQMAVSEELLGGGVHSLGLYAQIPYYISTNPWPQASIDLLSHLADVSSLTFDTAMLEAQVPEAAATIASMLEDAPALGNIVTDLEERFDEMLRIENVELPSGDELEEELQQFLRDQDTD